MNHEKPSKLSKIQEEQKSLPDTSRMPDRVAAFLKNEELAKAMSQKERDKNE